VQGKQEGTSGYKHTVHFVINPVSDIKIAEAVERENDTVEATVGKREHVGRSDHQARLSQVTKRCCRHFLGNVQTNVDGSIAEKTRCAPSPDAQIQQSVMRLEKPREKNLLRALQGRCSPVMVHSDLLSIHAAVLLFHCHLVT
jgi:hypothetical protein